MQKPSNTNELEPVSQEGIFLSNFPDTENSPLQTTNNLILALGGHAKTARYFGVTRSAVFQWSRKGVPGNRVMALCRLADHKVKPEQIRPDIFGNAPGLGANTASSPC